MSLLNNLLSSIDPAAATHPGARQPPATGSPKPAARPAVGANNGGSQGGALKRKADGQPDGGQAKLQRKDVSAQPARPISNPRPSVNPAVRPPPASEVGKAKSTTPTNTIPYRGTAGTGGLNAAKSASIGVKKTTPALGTQAATAKPAVVSKPALVSKPAAVSKPTNTPAPGGPPKPVAKKGYAAMLQQAKQREQTKAPAPPVRHEPTKILTKKEREALRAAAKGKQPATNGQKGAANPAKTTGAKPTDTKARLQEKPKAVGYQGTARPTKKPVEIGYKGTAKPNNTASGPPGKFGGAPATKSKQNQQANRYDGYANWSDLDDMEDEEEDYESEDDLSDMEGGMWDVEDEEQLALKAARKEDAEALAEENEHRRQKEERKRKLAAMAKAAAGKKRF